MCLCIRKPMEYLAMMRAMGKDMSMINMGTGFGRWCGSCKNPCALKWKPKMSEDEAMAEEGQFTKNYWIPSIFIFNKCIFLVFSEMNNPLMSVPRPLLSLMRVAMNAMDN